MATAPPPPTPAAAGSKNRTVITITALIGIVALAVLLALYGKSQSRRRRLEELQLQNELRRSGYRRRRKREADQGLAPALLQFIPVIRYNSSPSFERRTQSLDLEKGQATADTQAWSLAQSQLSIKAMQVEMNEMEERLCRNEDSGGCRKLTQEFEQEECPICTQPFIQNEYVRVLPCRHMHHKNCIDAWLLGFSGTCPVCRVHMGTFQLQPSEAADGLQKPEPALVAGENFAPEGLSR